MPPRRGMRGMETIVRPRSIVGRRPGAGSFRLVLASKDNATTGVLTVQRMRAEPA